MGAPDQKKLQTWDLPAREERCQADYQEVGSWSSSPEVFKQYFLLFPLLYHFMIKFQTRKSSNSKLPAWSRSLISSAFPSMLKYVNLISGILLMYCSEIAKLSLNLRQSSFFACARVFGKKFFVHIYFTMNCVQEVPIGFISWLSELYARLSPIPFMIQIFCNAICKIGLSW